MRTVLDRAAQRGEIDPAASLPVVVVLHELPVARRTPSDALLEEIVDLLFLPLVMLQKDRRA
ncbi:hypothetical protein [Streptomyces sp. NPDC060322]|uniref:hypothetical protein n=1 Tax=Streptomyces sp. NPDC060322 TaxID=3347097 RepID=UPI00365E069D